MTKHQKAWENVGKQLANKDTEIKRLRQALEAMLEMEISLTMSNMEKGWIRMNAREVLGPSEMPPM